MEAAGELNKFCLLLIKGENVSVSQSSGVEVIENHDFKEGTFFYDYDGSKDMLFSQVRLKSKC